jgi:hypothetical protein
MEEKMRIVSILVLTFFVLSMFACGSKPEPKPLMGGTEVNVPEWYLNPPQDSDYLYAAATATSKDMQLASEKAKQQGRADLATQLEAKVSGLTKKFEEEVGLGEEAEYLSQFTQVSKTVVSTVLTGTRVSKNELLSEAGIYRSYVLMELPVGAAAAAFKAQIANNEAMYTRFRSTKAFEELNDEVEKYEQFKKEQGMLK